MRKNIYHRRAVFDVEESPFFELHNRSDVWKNFVRRTQQSCSIKTAERTAPAQRTQG